MATYADIAKQLNAAAEQKHGYERDLNDVAAAFVVEIDRLWETDRKVRYGRLGENGVFESGHVGELDSSQTAKFLVELEFTVANEPVKQTFPAAVQRLSNSARMFVDPGNSYPIDVNVPISFLSPINALQHIVWSWVRSETAKAQIAQ